MSGFLWVFPRYNRRRAPALLLDDLAERELADSKAKSRDAWQLTSYQPGSALYLVSPSCRPSLVRLTSCGLDYPFYEPACLLYFCLCYWPTAIFQVYPASEERGREQRRTTADPVLAGTGPTPPCRTRENYRESVNLDGTPILRETHGGTLGRAADRGEVVRGLSLAERGERARS